MREGKKDLDAHVRDMRAHLGPVQPLEKHTVLYAQLINFPFIEKQIYIHTGPVQPLEKHTVLYAQLIIFFFIEKQIYIHTGPVQ